MKFPLFCSLIVVASACGEKKPSGLTVRVSSPTGWTKMGLRVSGQGASFDTDYAKFYKKQREQEISEPLDPSIKSVEGLAVELIIRPTPCGEVTKRATLKVYPGVNEADVIKKGNPIPMDIVTTEKPAASTRFILDAPGAKSVKIGQYELDEHDRTVNKGVTLYATDCAPLAVAIDGKPLDVKIVDGALEGVTIQPETEENEKHEFVPVRDRTAAYLITTRTDTCYKEASRSFGAAGSEPKEKLLSGGNVYKLAWATVDHILEEMPTNVAVTVTSADDAARASASRTAVWAVPCPAAAPPTP